MNGSGNSEVLFQEYLKEMIGCELAETILSMTEAQKKQTYIIITGVQGSTGKTTLCRNLRAHGYLALELHQCMIVELNNELQGQIPNFNV